jgi:chromosome segregation ATPase
MGEPTIEQQLAEAQAEVARLQKDNKAQKDKEKVLTNEVIELGGQGEQTRENLAIRLRDSEEQVELLTAKVAELRDRIAELEGT